jgi:hypothetical protein
MKFNKSLLTAKKEQFPQWDGHPARPSINLSRQDACTTKKFDIFLGGSL